jgi:uncharacterized protein (DUF1786 family)
MCHLVIEQMENDQGHNHSDVHRQEAAQESVAGQTPLRVLAIDVGAGTQDILVYDGRTTPENCVKLVVPSQTQVIAGLIRAVTAAGSPLHLSGRLMGGGASSGAVADHLAAGLPVTAEPDVARTLHNNLDRVRAMGVNIQESAPPGATIVELGDVDLPAIGEALAHFGVEMPDTVAIAVQDHGYRPGASNNDVRFEYLQRLVENGGALVDTVFREAPDGMTRMEAVAGLVPGAYLMDTGAAAVLGSLGDPVVARAVDSSGAILVNVGNMHTFATLVKARRLYGLFEHHTGGITLEIIQELVERLRVGTIDAARFTREFDGHGAALDPVYRDVGPFDFVAITGPNRALARPLGYHEAAPHGDMMLTGSYGLVEGVLMRMAADGNDTGLSLSAP